MRLGLIRVVMFSACLVVGAAAAAQYGHPLKGTWIGDWGPTRDNRTHVLLDIHWDGKALAGTLNPGPNAAPLQKLTLDVDAWTIHFEADGKDKSGNVVRSVVDGKLENIGAFQRFITGTWTQGSVKGDFKVTRN